MSIFRKLSAAVRGHATELAEEIVDANALTILDQEIRDASKELDSSKRALADIMGKKKLQESKLSELRSQVERYESHAMSLSEDDPLFVEVCTKIESLENQAQPIEGLIGQLTVSENQLKKAISQAENNLSALRSQVDTVRATAQVQRAQEAVSTKFAGNNASLASARGSLDRIREKQAAKAAQLEAAQEVGNMGVDDLDARLAKSSTGSSVADRIRAKRAGS